MKKFMVLYMANGAEFERMMKNSTPEQQKKGMEAWMKWMGDHKASLVDGGAPLGKTKRVDAKGASDTKNDIGGYSIVQAETADAAATLIRQGPSASADARRLGGNHRSQGDTRDVSEGGFSLISLVPFDAAWRCRRAYGRARTGNAPDVSQGMRHDWRHANVVG